MPRLFEQFVAEWLRKNAPSRVSVKSQYKVDLDGSGRLSFKIDMVLFDAVENRPLAVLDTKYKGNEMPTEQDIQQILAYAGEMGVKDAYLIYPSPTTETLDLPPRISPIRVHTLIFNLGADIEVAGKQFLDGLLRQISPEPAVAPADV
jgi:5-methylcytosine-specific restriction enzyme subunit McrC